MANGGQTSTQFDVNNINYNGVVTAEAVRPIMKEVLDCLLMDYPYDLYWFDKTQGYAFGVSSSHLPLSKSLFSARHKSLLLFLPETCRQCFHKAKHQNPHRRAAQYTLQRARHCPACQYPARLSLHLLMRKWLLPMHKRLWRSTQASQTMRSLRAFGKRFANLSIIIMMQRIRLQLMVTPGSWCGYLMGNLIPR